MNRIIVIAFLALLATVPASADEARRLNIVASLPDIASIARSVGGDLVEVTSLARGFEDPHYVTPTPALMTAVSRADVYLEIGMSLELWSEPVLDGARNAKVRVGAPGHEYVSRDVRALDVPAVVSRSQGDLHPEGNPHIWLDPLNGLLMARNIRDALTRVAPDRAADFARGYAGFEAETYRRLYGADLVALLGGPLLARLDRAGELTPFLEKRMLEGQPLVDRLGGMAGRARILRGRPIVFYHPSWVYFAERFGLTIRGYVEDKPGIAPTAKHRDELIALVKSEGIPVIAVENYYPRQVPDAIAAATGARVLLLPHGTGGEAGADDYLSFLELIVDRLAGAYSEGK